MNLPVFEPIRTERLLLRGVRASDVDALRHRRNDPRVAELQAWALPYTIEQAQGLIEGAMKDDEPPTDDWWMITVADDGDAEVIGDLALHLKWDGRAAEVGFTLDSSHWGKGYATEATGALVDWLFSHEELTRVEAMLHPDNGASARVLEKLGMKYEGRTRLSYWVGDDNTDDLLYGMIRDDWTEWNTRPTHPPNEVRLFEITPDNYFDVGRLETHRSQRQFVATMAQSYADALFPEVWGVAQVVPWMRGVEADGEMVGFVMVAEMTEHHREPYLWRLLIDRLHQRRGIGRRVLDLVVDDVRQKGAGSLSTSWTEGPGSPRHFYEKLGFAATGVIIDGETEGRLAW